MACGTRRHAASSAAARPAESVDGEFKSMISRYFFAELTVPRTAKPGVKKSLSPMLRRGRLLE
jgi:hypothetical protein